MKKKIIGTLVCLLMISTIVFPVAAKTDIHDIQVFSNDADIPVWEVNDE